MFILNQLKIPVSLSEYGIFVSRIGGSQLSGGNFQYSQPYRYEHFLRVVDTNRIVSIGQNPGRAFAHHGIIGQNTL